MIMKHQNLLFPAFSLFILFILACNPSHKASSNSHQYQTTCSTDSDCVLVNKDCCGCNAGGESIAINRSQENTYNSALKSRCSRDLRACPAWYRCKEFKAQCLSSKCVAIKK